jgi:hypothetical protein
MAGQAKRKKEKEFSLLGGSRSQMKRWVNHERHEAHEGYDLGAGLKTRFINSL